MEKQFFTRYKFTDTRTGDLIRYMNINDRLEDHVDRLKKMQSQIYNEIKIPVTAIHYELAEPAS
jgi:xanthine dehydrogenase iron-sulfur cluster and FAD-binding subunit A